MNSISTKEIEINNVEKMCSEIQGVENPSTLNANLANLRSKWQQVSEKYFNKINHIYLHLMFQDLLV